MASPDVATLVGHLLPLTHQASSIVYTPTSPITATDVQSALDQLAGWTHTGTGTDNSIVRWDGTNNIQDSLVQIADTTGKIFPTTSNANLILDGNGTGVVQHNTGSDSYQMPKTRATGGIPGVKVLRCAPSSGDCDWMDISALLVPSWQTTYDATSGSPSYFDLKASVGMFQVRDGASPLGTDLFRVTDTTGTSSYLAVSATKIYTEGYGEFGDPGTETSGVNISGTTYTLGLRVNDIGGGRQGQFMMHRHSTSFGSIMFGSRSYSDTSAHTDVINDLDLMGIVGAGWTSSSYKQFGKISIRTDASGTISSTSAPGAILFYTTQDGSTSPTLGMTLDRSQKLTVVGDISGATITGTQLNVDNLRLDGNTLSSTSGALILDANATGIQMSDAVEMGSNLFKLGSSNQGAISHDGTSLIINPKVSGTSDVVIGSSSASAGNDANLRVYRLGLFGSDISTTSAINCTTTGALRSALIFNLTFTGSGSVASPFICNFTDTGSGTNILFASTLEYTLKTATHNTTAATKASVLNIQTGIDSSINLTTGTDHYFTCLKLVPNGKGVGTGTHTVNLYSTGLFQKKMTAFTTSGAATYVGSYWGDDVCLEQETKLYLASTETDAVAQVAVTKGNYWLQYTIGTTSIDFYNNANKMLMINAIDTGVKAGTSTTYAKVGGTLEVNTTAAGTPASTTETDLQTYSIPANSMATNGDSISFEMSFTTAANANTKRLKIKYGATTMYDGTALALNGATITARGRIIRTGAATQNYYIEVQSNSVLLVATSAQGTAAETLSGAVTLKATGQNGTATANDLVQGNGVVHFHPNK